MERQMLQAWEGYRQQEVHLLDVSVGRSPTRRPQAVAAGRQLEAASYAWPQKAAWDEFAQPALEEMIARRR